MEQFYANDVTMQENETSARVGKQRVWNTNVV